MSDPDKGPKNDKATEHQADPGRAQANIAGLVVIAVILVVGLLIASALIAESKREDCLLARRRNCDQILNAG